MSGEKGGVEERAGPLPTSLLQAEPSLPLEEKRVTQTALFPVGGRARVSTEAENATSYG